MFCKISCSIPDIPSQYQCGHNRAAGFRATSFGLRKVPRLKDLRRGGAGQKGGHLVLAREDTNPGEKSGRRSHAKAWSTCRVARESWGGHALEALEAPCAVAAEVV